jgi:PPOX class probable F420-dependent enzyme
MNNYKMAKMSKEEVIRFLMQGTFTGKLATTSKNNGAHVVPIWFVLDNENSIDEVGDIVFGIYDTSAEAKNIKQDNRVSICVDDQSPLFSFVTIFGTAKMYPYEQEEVLMWATKIAERYMGKENAEEYGRRNSGEGIVLVRITPERIIGEKDTAGWE